MTELEIFSKIIVALVIGALIGVEREMASIETTKRKLAGLRTFIFISLLGAMSGYISLNYLSWFLAVAFGIFSLVIIVGYYSHFQKEQRTGLTTTITTLIAFLLGAVTMIGSQVIAIAVAILIVVFLSLKKRFGNIIKHITSEELYDTLKFALIAFVVLPFLPNETYGPLDVLNPYVIWLMVVFISGIGFSAFLLIKVLGPKRGIGLTGLLGGFVSSTAVTSSMAIKSKEATKFVNAFAFAALVASSTSALRVLFEVFVLNRSLTSMLVIPMSIMALIGFMGAYYLWHGIDSTQAKHGTEFQSPFRLGPALKFGIFFAVVLFIAKAGHVYLGSAGIYLTSILSGLADVDAITISMSQLSKSAEITNDTAVNAITIAVASNMSVKAGIAILFGSREFGKKVAIVTGLLLVAGLASTFFI